MTTTVILQTHDWPAEVRTSDNYEAAGVRTHNTRIEVVKPNTTQQFHLTDTRTLFFKELPKP